MTKIAHILGDWSRNIGNAFFQLGGLWVLQQVLPDSKIILINEQPGYPSYWLPRGGNPKNSFDTPSALDVDYLVLMGPMFRPETENIWGDSLSRVIAKGTRIILLGVGAMKYDHKNISYYRSFLKKYQPYILMSRDQETFDLLGDLAVHTYSGIDFGFFMPEVYQPIGFTGSNEKFVALNFDKIPEPQITISSSDRPKKQLNVERLDRKFEFDGEDWTIKFHSLRTKIAESSRIAMFLEGILFNGNGVAKEGKYTFIRLDHRPHPMIARKTFRSPNVVFSDTPYIYLEVYKQAVLTLSTRVHACVIALSYGNPAMLFSHTPRVKLLARLGVSQISCQPTRLNLDKLQKEKLEIIEFLKMHLDK